MQQKIPHSQSTLAGSNPILKRVSLSDIFYRGGYDGGWTGNSIRRGGGGGVCHLGEKPWFPTIATPLEFVAVTGMHFGIVFIVA